ncbi:MAG: TVP38/TMEM64 family protein [Pseudomonadota bacterium]
MTSAKSEDPREAAPPEVAKKKSGWRRWLPFVLLISVSLLAFAYLWSAGGISFKTVGDHWAWLQQTTAANPFLAGISLMLLYSLLTALSLPLATLVTVVAGALFGVVMASIWVVLGATAGSMIVFLAARGALHDTFMSRAGPWLKRMEKGFREDAFSYLLVLRLLPIFPFWLVNLVPALLGVPLRIYVLATAMGIIPGVVVYTALGNGLGAVLARGETPDLSLILEPKIFLPLVGLALFALLPVGYKRWQARKRQNG